MLTMADKGGMGADIICEQPLSVQYSYGAVEPFSVHCVECVQYGCM